MKCEQVAVLPVRNRRVGQVASHMAVSLTKAAHRVLSVADADVQAGTQPKIVAHVMQRSALIAMLKGVERHDGRVRQRLRWCHTCAVGPGAGGKHTVHEICLLYLRLPECTLPCAYLR